ncbi:hypothetical protein [Eggerthella timonensis]|uniref:hypothetical protein n=1 Tax=Eggerthella timonensis TaxID=1871008 RepID=UPI000C77AE09|nr:hypothetical protein [Eggerthella timonensis]
MAERTETESKAGSARKRIALALAILLLLALGAGALLLCGQSGAGPFFDANAKVGQAPYKSKEQMQEELGRVVAEGMFNISIASVIEFPSASEPGTAYIENVPGNRYAMKAAVTLDSTGETVYESGGIAPGSYLEDIVLAKRLEPGEYEATALFTAFDVDTFDEVGKAAARITLIVRG